MLLCNVTRIALEVDTHDSFCQSIGVAVNTPTSQYLPLALAPAPILPPYQESLDPPMFGTCQ